MISISLCTYVDGLEVAESHNNLLLQVSDGGVSDTGSHYIAVQLLFALIVLKAIQILLWDAQSSAFHHAMFDGHVSSKNATMRLTESTHSHL